MNSIQIAKKLMKLRENWPNSPDISVGELEEVFRHNLFLEASVSEKREMMLKSSITKYESEKNYPWDNYFGIDLRPLIRNKVVLDLGCFNGGRGVAWFERYKLKELYGIDIDQVYIDSALQFSSIKNINAKYMVAKGEQLPFEDLIFDAILSFDVFEHVQNIQRTLGECWRVLRPNGCLFLVFPSYFHPFAHHLDLVSETPFIHYFFNSTTLIKAYNEILEDRGQEAYWYKRNSPLPETWERCNTINGTTLRQLKSYIKNSEWDIIMECKKPLGSVGRNVSNNKWLHLVSYFFYPLTFIPGIQEMVLQRITFILKKRSK